MVAAGRSLTELRSVGPWVGRVILGWLEAPPDAADLESPELRRDFLTLAEARATVAAHPHWRSDLRADLQMHTTWSDGKATLREMVAEAAGFGYEHVLVTDHSQGLKIARGMDEEELSEQADEVAAVNEELGIAEARASGSCTGSR